MLLSLRGVSCCVVLCRADGDHLVGFANSSLRSFEQLPPPPPEVATAKGVVLQVGQVCLCRGVLGEGPLTCLRWVLELQARAMAFTTVLCSAALSAQSVYLTKVVWRQGGLEPCGP